MKVTIVGAGLSAATASHLLVSKGHQVEVFETRNHIGGNCFDSKFRGLRIHNYGPHAFHTNNKEVWDFVNKFSEFDDFKLRVYAETQSGNIIPIPFNVMSSHVVGDWDSAKIVDELFKTYSIKHWGVEWDKLPASITSRVPKKKESSDGFYHDDLYQGLPKYGYTSMIENMFEGATVHIGCYPNDWKKSRYDLLIYTGSIDSFFDYELGTLSYRSLKFTYEDGMDMFWNQLNQCNNKPHTREINHSFWTPNFSGHRTVISKEYSEEFDRHNLSTDRFYPKSFQSNDLYQAYKSQTPSKVIFLGRLGTYKYLDMDDCITQAQSILKQNSL